MVVYQFLTVPHLNEVDGMFIYHCVPIIMKVCSVFLLRNIDGYNHYNQTWHYSLLQHLLGYILQNVCEYFV